MAVTHQPGRFEPSDFQTSLCDFCGDCGTCCYAVFCYPCLGCSIASDMDECCLCGLGMPIRSVYRTRYNIRGSMCKDFLATACCPICATCQLKRDIDRRKEQGHLLNGCRHGNWEVVNQLDVIKDKGGRPHKTSQFMVQIVSSSLEAPTRDLLICCGRFGSSGRDADQRRSSSL